MNAHIIRFTLVILTCLFHFSAFSQLFGPEHLVMDVEDAMEYPEAFTIADLDGDTHLDIVACSRDDHKIIWFKNDGAGHFEHAETVIYDLGETYYQYEYPLEIYAEDLDNDNDLDLLVRFFDYGKIAWFENEGGGVFGPVQDIDPVANNPRKLVPVDLDSDGDTDVVYRTGPNQEFYYRLNDGNANFGAETFLGNDGLPYDFYGELVDFQDMDNDGIPDLITDEDWYKHDGNFGFSAPYNIATGTYEVDRLVDLDGDGDLDALFANINNNLSWSANDGSGNFGSAQTLAAGMNDIRTLTIGDVDNDGDTDIVTASWDITNGGLYWVENLGGGSFATAQYLMDDEAVSHLMLMDLDNDGDAELVTALASDDRILSHINDGAGNFNETEIVSATYRGGGYKMFPSDLDNDGDDDILTVGFYGHDAHVVMFENEGGEVFSQEQVLATDVLLHLVVDFDNDGDDDLLTSEKALYIHENTDNGNFIQHTVHTYTGNFDNFYDAKVADMDNDGDLDIIASHDDDSEVVWFKNEGNYTFGPKLTIDGSAYSARTLAIGDFDEDGYNDVVFSSSSYLEWYKNNGDDTFTAQPNFQYGGSSGEVIVDDFNSDGKPDILVLRNAYSNSSYDNIYWYRNTGGGTFTYQAIELGILWAKDMTAVDFDNDGDLDITLSCNESSDVRWYENNGGGLFSSAKHIAEVEDFNWLHTPFDKDNDGDLDLFLYSSYSLNGETMSQLSWIENLSNSYYVDQSATGNNDGSSWEDAYTDLQSALTTINGGAIHMAEGKYVPTTTTQRGVAFEIPSLTSIYGGYPAGGGTRDPKVYETVLSGDIDNSTAIANDSYHVVSVKDSERVYLDGLIIRDGNANNANSFGRSRGGGLYVKGSTIELNNVEVKWNRAIYGGGIFATLSPDVQLNHCVFKKNRAENGAAIYHSNSSEVFINYSQIIDNTSTGRCAIEVNNSLNTEIDNSLIANNASAFANAIGFIATNRDQFCVISSTTILGGSTNRALITAQVGFNDQLNLSIRNSIVAHQNPAFNKNVVAFNNGVFNFNHDHNYFQGSSVVGNGSNNLFSATDGNLLLNSDYSLDACSPAVNAGDYFYNNQDDDLAGMDRVFGGQIDMGCYETQEDCVLIREFPEEISEREVSITIAPNPASHFMNIQIRNASSPCTVRVFDMLSREVFQTQTQEDIRIPVHDWTSGMYTISIQDENGEQLSNEKWIKR